MEFLYLIAGLIIGTVSMFIILTYVFKSKITIAIAQEQSRCIEEISRLKDIHNNEIKDAEKRAVSAETLIVDLRKVVEEYEKEVRRLRDEIEAERLNSIQKATEIKEANKRLDETKYALDTQLNTIEKIKADIIDKLSLMSTNALRITNEEFLRLATENLGKIVSETNSRLTEHKSAIELTVRPLQEMLSRNEEMIRLIEENRNKSFGSITQHINSLMDAHNSLKLQTQSLVTALRKPKVSGMWGELGLKNVLNLAGLTDYIDFIEQQAISTEDGRYQPDVIVRLPNGRAIVIDAKAPVDSFLNALSVEDEKEKKKALDQYVSQIRNHIKSLKSKSYWEKVTDSPEMIVMFLPTESFYSSAIEHDPKLIEDSAKDRIIIATPTTLIGLLKVVAYGWQQKQITENALKVSELGRDLFDRFVVVIEHLDKLGKNLNSAVKSYNDGVGSIQTRLIPKIKQIKEYGIISQKEIPLISEINLKCKEGEIISNDSDTRKENIP